MLFSIKRAFFPHLLRRYCTRQFRLPSRSTFWFQGPICTSCYSSFPTQPYNLEFINSDITALDLMFHLKSTFSLSWADTCRVVRVLLLQRGLMCFTGITWDSSILWLVTSYLINITISQTILSLKAHRPHNTCPIPTGNEERRLRYSQHFKSGGKDTQITFSYPHRM